MTEADHNVDHVVELPEGGLTVLTNLSVAATQEATQTAMSSIEASLGWDVVSLPKVDLLSDLESLAKQTQGRATETLNVIINDHDSTCEDFDYDIGNLTESQATQLLIQIVSRRGIEENHARELEKIALRSSLGFFSKLAGLFAKGS